MLAFDYPRIRRTTVQLVAGLGPEDCMIQAMPDVSPPKWHLAHTTWFFETFVLKEYLKGYKPLSSDYDYLFNSYYESVGPRHPRPARGLLSRPTLDEVVAYRAYVDRAIESLLESAPPDVSRLIELGLHHEQQHQELLIMDAKYNFWSNPLRPAHRSDRLQRCRPAAPLQFHSFEGGLVRFGYDGAGFAFDNEQPAHRRFVEPFELANRLITNTEMLEFVGDGGYRTPSLWLSEGWSWVSQNAIEAPLYWFRNKDGEFAEFTSHGVVDLDPNAAVCHVSAFEAAAFAAWTGARLPTEFEWELAARHVGATQQRGLEDEVWHPRSGEEAGVCQLFGDVWQWTRSAYEPYPGFVTAQGAVGEYNGKFMCGQWVLRGGSAITPRAHSRVTYRNFFYPHQRWPFTGIRLAREVR